MDLRKDSLARVDIENNECNMPNKEQILHELENCDFETFVAALNLAYGQSMAANDVFFVGKLEDEAFFYSILKYMSESRFGAMNLMDIVRGLIEGDSQVDYKHKYVTYTPSLDGASLQSYEDLDDLKKSFNLEEITDSLREDNTYQDLFPNESF